MGEYEKKNNNAALLLQQNDWAGGAAYTNARTHTHSRTYREPAEPNGAKQWRSNIPLQSLKTHSTGLINPS